MNPPFRALLWRKLSQNKALSIILSLPLLLYTTNVFAGSATWALDPASDDWNTAINWMPNTVPNDSADTATFERSNQNSLSLSADTVVDGIHFMNGADPYTIVINPGLFLTFAGTGVTNDSGISQSFLNAAGEISNGSIVFDGESSAGIDTTFFSQGGIKANILGASISFLGNATAGSSLFTLEGAASENARGAFISFQDFASANEGVFICNRAVPGGLGGGFIDFFGHSTAANATFVLEGASAVAESGAFLQFFEDASLSNATVSVYGGLTIDAPGGLLRALTKSTGGSCRLEIFGNGIFDLRYHTSGLTIGSLNGDGLVDLGSNTLRIGDGGFDSNFSGTIGINESSGSLTKIGLGLLKLSGANTYSGGTTVSEGGLAVDNVAGSATGSGPVQVNAGLLAGKGTISGAVTLGTGRGAGAELAPGQGAASMARLKIESTLSWKADGSFRCRLNTKKEKADQVVADGVTIENGAQFNLEVTGEKRLRPGRVITVISNTAATSIAGTFANLPDGSIISAGPNTLRVSYRGGDGNDLTLTVVP